VEQGAESSERMVELDHRSSGWLDVSLFWDRAAKRLFVQVIDWSGEQDLAIPVSPGTALQVFHHPFAYAGVGA